MRQHLRLPIVRAAVCGLALLAAAPPAAGPAFAEEVTTLAQSDPCGFFRNRARGKGLLDPATEMLWACEAIAARRTARMPLGERLTATQAALERFRGAVLDAAASVSRNRSDDFPGLGLGAGRERELAEASGVTAALEAIRDRY